MTSDFIPFFGKFTGGCGAPGGSGQNKAVLIEGGDLCQVFLDGKVLAFCHPGETVVEEGGVWRGCDILP